LRFDERVLDEAKAKGINVKPDCIVVILDDDSHIANGLFHSLGPVRWNSMGLCGTIVHRNSKPNARPEPRLKAGATQERRL
jgi:hypothetical protein